MFFIRQDIPTLRYKDREKKIPVKTLEHRLRQVIFKGYFLFFQTEFIKDVSLHSLSKKIRYVYYKQPSSLFNIIKLGKRERERERKDGREGKRK